MRNMEPNDEIIVVVKNCLFMENDFLMYVRGHFWQYDEAEICKKYIDAVRNFLPEKMYGPDKNCRLNDIKIKKKTQKGLVIEWFIL